ncbi:MAG: choice-of-anchor D domain-containing protein [Verrucomicrobiota bacterium]
MKLPLKPSRLRHLVSSCCFLLLSLTAMAAPEIEVQQPAGTNLTDGAATVTFPKQIIGIGSRTRVFTVRNTGPDPLTGLSALIDGANPEDFTATTLPASLAANGTTTLTVTFATGDVGARLAVLRILSDDTDEASFDISLAGEGVALDAIAEAAYLKAGATDELDRFGLSVSISGDTVVIGAPGEDSSAPGIDGNEADNNATDAGAAYVFVRDGDGRWTRQAYLKASNPDSSDQFGARVDIDGDTLVVGAYGEASAATGINGNEADNSAINAGAAYVFTRTAGVWSQQAYLKAHNASELDTFGTSVAISGDRVVVGAQTEGLEVGAAYVFRRSGSVWSQEKFLKASNGSGLDLFGVSVDIAGDIIVVGATGEASSATGVNGNESDNAAINAGAAYIFFHNGSDWVQQAYLKASNTSAQDRFGCAVAVSGETVVVGAYQEGGDASGAAYVFTSTAGVWSQQAYLKASNTGSGDQFGQAVAIEGDLLLVGADGEASNSPGVGGTQSNNSLGSAGAVYAYTRTLGAWSQQAYVKSPSPILGEYFHTVAVSQRTAIIGAYGDGSSATGVNGDDSISSAVLRAGAAYVFNNLGFPLPVTISSASILSDNATSTAHAKDGDTLTLSFTASDALDGLPAVTLAGRAATVTDLGSQAYAATLLVDGTEAEGPVSFLISAQDLEGTPVTATATTDSSSVTVDRTAPVITPVSIASNNTVITQAVIGDTITLSFTVNEDLASLPTVIVAGRAATVTPGAGGSYTATLIVQPADPAGEVAFVASVLDFAGHGSSTSATTDASSVEILLPEIAVEEPAATDLADGDSRDFGSLPVGGNASLQFTIRNTGDTPLSGIGITLLGLHAADFTVTDAPDAVVAPGGDTTFTVQFLSLGGGPRTATLQIASNDGDEDPFDIELTGDAFYTLAATYTTGAEVALTTSVNESFVATGSTVSLTLDHAPATGAELRVIDNIGLDFITGTFTGLDQGQVVTLPYGGVNYTFVANYYGGDGNDLALVWARTSLHAWGPNIFGQLGDGTFDDHNLPVPVKNDGALAGKTVIAVASGYVHSVALCSDGSLYSWGFNIIGQLGDGTYDDSQEPVAVKVTGTALEGKRPVAIAAGAAHTLVLCSDGTVVAWGDNEMGQLGDDTGIPSNEAVAVLVEGTALEGRKVVGIVTGAGHSLARCSDGTVVAWGMNVIGQLGTGDEEAPFSFTPVAVATTGTALDGKAVKAITAGAYSSAALCTDGTLATWGDNEFSQLGNGNLDPSYVPVPVLTAGTALQGKTVTAIASGTAHITALCSDGTVVGWGDNYFGQLADGTLGDEDGSPPVAALASGTALAGKTIVAITAGSGFSIARASDGSLISWGSNYYGELGNGDDEDAPLAVFVGTGTLSPEQRFTAAVSGPMAAHTLAFVASPAEREIVFLGPDGSPLTASSSVDFGLVVLDDGAFRTFTLRNIGGTSLEDLEATLSGPDAALFSLVPPLGSDTLAADGQLSFQLQFSPAALGAHEATLTLASNDVDEPAFVIALAALVVESLPPVPVASPLGDAVSGEDAPGADGSSPIGRFELLRRGGFLAENGTLAFPGSLVVEAGPPTVTLEDSQGVWKHDGSSLLLIARTGSFLPDLPGCVFDYLPQVPAINDDGEVTLLASLRIGIGGVTSSDDTGIWSELGGVEMSLLFLEGDSIFEDDSVEIGRFASGAYATAKTSATTGEIAFSVTFRDAETDALKLTDTAVIRGSVDEFFIYSEVVAREGTLAPGTAVNFGNLTGSYTDPARMDPQGNLTFAALTLPGNKEGLWTQTIDGDLEKVFFAGDTAPGTGGATFSRLQRPSAGSNGIIAFRALLNADGDNTASTRNDGIWRGEAADPASFQCILRRGDGTAVVPGLPVGALVGNLWGGWLTQGNRGAWKGWLDVDGNGTSAAPTDKHALYADTSGTMALIVTVGDAVPGVPGATFTGFDLPVVGGQEQLAFLGNLTGGGSTSADNEGLWRQDSNGGPLALALRKGQAVTTTQGVKTIQKIDFPGSGQTDRRWEQPVMDGDGRLLVYITFTDGSSTQLLIP